MGSSNTKINPVTTALMPISQIVSWYFVLQACRKKSEEQRLINNSAKLSSVVSHGHNNDTVQLLNTTLPAVAIPTTINDPAPLNLQQLYQVVGPIAFFYSVWAAYDIFVLDEADLGLFTMIVLFIGAFLQQRWLTVIGNILVWLNYVIPSFWIVLIWNVYEVLDHLKNIPPSLTTLTWAYIIKAYFISNVFLWTYTLYYFTTLKVVNNNRQQQQPIPDSNVV